MSVERHRPYPADAPHSLLGRFSLGMACAAAAGAAAAVALLYAMEVAESHGLDMAVERVPGRTLAGVAILLFLASWLSSLGGLVLGLACLTQSSQRKSAAAWGAALNGLFFFGVLTF